VQTFGSSHLRDGSTICNVNFTPALLIVIVAFFIKSSKISEGRVTPINALVDLAD